MIKKKYSSEFIEGEILLYEGLFHPYMYIFFVFILGFMIFGCFSVYIFQEILFSTLGAGLFWGIFTTFFVLCLVFEFLIFLGREIQLFSLTNIGIHGIIKTGLFSYKYIRIPYSDIGEIHAHSQGLLATGLKFGSIKIREKSTQTYYDFYHIRHPGNIVPLIHEEVKKMNKFV